jgi:hypothetical protein
VTFFFLRGPVKQGKLGKSGHRCHTNSAMHIGEACTHNSQFERGGFAIFGRQDPRASDGSPPSSCLQNCLVCRESVRLKSIVRCRREQPPHTCRMPSIASRSCGGRVRTVDGTSFTSQRLPGGSFMPACMAAENRASRSARVQPQLSGACCCSFLLPWEVRRRSRGSKRLLVGSGSAVLN